MRTIECAAMTPDQFRESRRGSLGASDLGVVAGLYGSRLELYLQKIGQLDGIEANEEMRAGLGLERHIAAEYCRATGRMIQVEQSMVISVSKWRHATIDAMCTDGRLCEWKAVGSRTASRLDPDGDPDSLPEGWLLQVHQAMDITCKPECDVCVFVGPELKTRIYTVSFRPGLAKAAYELGRQFWFNHVVPRIPPTDFTAGDLAVVRQAFREDTGAIEVWGQEELAIAMDCETFASMRRIKESAVKDWKEKEDAARADLLFRLGNASGAEMPDGWSVRRKVRNRRAYTVEATTVVNFKIIKPKESEL